MTFRVVPEDFENGGIGYTITLSGDTSKGKDPCINVSVQDYLNALNKAFLSPDFLRIRGGAQKLCQGCDVCCGERMPMTLIDLKVLAQSPVVREIFKEKLNSDSEEALVKMVRRFCRVYVKDGSVDITLRLGEDGKCRFLNRETKTCSIYDFRPFVCQAYICCPVSEEALEVRRTVVNAGEDELVRWWLSHAADESIEFWYDEADNPCVDLDDWKPGPFTGKGSYQQVMLKDVLSPELLNKLRGE